MPIVTIDGNIGCGKTSLLNYLHRYNKMVIDLEPVDNWLSHLNKMYNENKDIFHFQIRVWLDRCWIQEKSDVLVLMERSPYFIRNVFVSTAFENQTISTRENRILQELHDKTDPLWPKTTHIYLRSSPESCFQKIQKRNRGVEKSITLEYLEQLHSKHEKCYNDLKSKQEICTYIDTSNKTVAEIAKEFIDILYQNNLKTKVV